MIKRKDVVRFRIPYPTVYSGLARKQHMYICCNQGQSTHRFVKCQTLKPELVQRETMVHYVDELPDSDRNPFDVPTRIDCDKVFNIQTDRIKIFQRPTKRPDVCEALMCTIEVCVNSHDCEMIAISYGEIVAAENM